MPIDILRVLVYELLAIQVIAVWAAYCLRRLRLEEALFLLGVLTLDVSTLALYRFFLLSDLLFLGAYAALVTTRQPAPLLLRPRPLFAALLLYTLSALVAAMAALDPGDALRTSVHLTFLALVYVPVTATLLAERPRLLAFSMLALAGTALFRALDLLAMIPAGMLVSWGPRLSGVLGIWPLFVMLPGLLGLVLALAARGDPALLLPRWACFLAAPLAAVATMAILVSKFRSLWVASVFAVLIILVLTSRSLPRLVARAAALPVALAGLWAAGMIPQAVVARVHQSLNPQAVDFGMRVAVIGILLPRFFENPWLGIGFNNSPLYLPPCFVAGCVGAIHNLVLNGAVEAGLLAAVGLLALPFLALRIYRRTARRPGLRLYAIWFLASFCGLYLGAQFTPNMCERTFWFVLAFGIGLLEVSRRSAEATAAGQAAAPAVALIVTDLHFGGTPRVVTRLALGLQAKGALRPVVISLAPLADLAETIAAAGVPVHSLDLEPGDQYRPLRLFQALIELRRLLRRHKVEVVYGLLFHGVCLAICAKLLLPRLQLVVGFRSLGWDGPGRLRIYRLARSRYAAAVANSEAGRRFLVEELGLPAGRVVTILNGVQTDKFLPASLPAAPVLGSLCRLDRKNSLQVAIEAMAVLRQTWPGLRYEIFGEGEERERLSALIERLGLSGCVSLMGATDDAVGAHHHLRIYLQPSEAEGMSNAVLEAMSCGRSVICTNVGGMAEAVTHGQTGLLVAPGKPEEIVQAVDRLLSNPELAEAMGRAGRQRIEERFGIEAMVERTQELLLKNLCRD